MIKKTSRSCVIIAGMHRSGTSALSRVIGLLGCALPKNLLPANPTNATGHWESERLSYFNDEILDAAGSSWDDWATCTPDWVNSPVMGEFARRALEIYGEEFGEANLAVLKDPRICRLLPFWLPLFEEANIKPYVILPIRNPKEVAASLAKRDGSDSYYNHLLWLRHVLEAEAGSRGVKRAFVTYNDLLENYSIVVSNTEERLGLKWPRRSARISEEIEAYLSDQHRHQKLSNKSMSGDLSSSDWMRQTYEIMSRWADTGEDLVDHPVLDQILADFNLSAQRFGRIVYRGKTAMSEVSAMKIVAHEKGTHIAQLNMQLANNAHENESKSALLAATLAANQIDLLALKNDLLHAQHQINANVINMKEQQAQLKVAEEEAVLLHATLCDAQEQHSTNSLLHTSQIDDRDRKLEEKQAQLKVAEEEAVLLHEALCDAQEKHSTNSLLHNSQIDDRDRKLEEKQAQLLALEEETTQLRAALQNAEEQLLENVATLDTLASDHNRKKSDMQTAADLAQSEIENLISISEQEKAEGHEKFAHLSRELEAANALQYLSNIEHNHKLIQIEQLNVDVVKGLKDTYSLAEQDNKALTMQLNDVEQENIQVTRQADILNIKLDEATRAREQAESNYVQKVSELEQLNATLIKGFRDTFTLAEQDNEDLTKRLKDAETALETLEQTRRSQMFEMNQVRSSLAQKKAEADDYHFEIKGYQVEKNELTQSIADLKTEISAARAQSSKLASQIRDIVTAMDNQNTLPLIPKRFRRARNRKILSAAGVVNQEWYLKSNPDVGALGVDATLHYVTHGASEGRSPNPEHESIKHLRNDA